MNQQMFFVDYSSFRNEVQPLIVAADKGDFIPVVERAEAIAKRIAPGKWIMEGSGATLKQLPRKDSQTRFTSWNVGFSFFAILTQFFSSSPELSRSLGNVTRAAQSLGWNERDVKLLSIGMATTTLLKPHLVADFLERPSLLGEWHDPANYWWCVRPENAFYSGWFDIERLQNLREKLLEIRDEIPMIDLSTLHLRTKTTKASFLQDYEDTCQLFDTAIKLHVGIFLNGS